MLEVILVITMLSSNSGNMNIETIDGFPSIQSCESFFKDWKESMIKNTNEIKAGNSLIIKDLQIIGNCHSKPMINRKFG